MSNTKLLVLFTISIIVIGLGSLFIGINQGINQSKALPISQPTPTPQAGILVTKVIDGDTIELENGAKVRYLGVDTPETKDPRKAVECFGKEAAGKNKELLEGKRVILEKDVSETDKYGRLLRFVYLPLPDGQLLFVNDYLIREGYGKVLTIPPDVKFAEQFLQAQREAREENKGLWGRC